MNSEKLNYSIFDKFNFERKPVGVKFAITKPEGITGMSRKPHVHNYDEAVFFIGSDPYALDDLGAEVEISIGEAGREEKHTFNKPSVRVDPKRLYHCPIVTNEIHKPYVRMAVSLTGKRPD